MDKEGDKGEVGEIIIITFFNTITTMICTVTPACSRNLFFKKYK